MKLYTEEQFLDACKSVAEKACAYSLDEDWIKEQCEYYGYTKFFIDLYDNLEDKMNDDDVNDIELVYFKAT